MQNLNGDEAVLFFIFVLTIVFAVIFREQLVKFYKIMLKN